MMIACGGCRQDATDTILCSKCSLQFDYNCAGITEAKYRRLSEKKKREWMCPACRINEPLSDSAPTAPVTLAVPALDYSAAAVPTLDLIMRRLDSMVLQLEPLKSLEGIRSDVSQLKIATESIVGRIGDVERRVTAVEQKQSAAAELQARVEELEKSAEAREQWLRVSNVEIKGVPQKTNENLFDVLVKIGVAISYTVVRERINFIARVPSREEGRTKSIIASFTHRYDKENFVAAGRLAKNLSVSDIGMQGTNRVFINDHLTVNQKQLLTSAKKLVKEKQYEFVWVKHGKIMVRRNETSPFIQIRSSNDLQKIK